MAHTQLRLRDPARARLLAGATSLADAVRGALGPKSRCILIGGEWNGPIVCNDGVTIAEQVDVPDPIENLGARMSREAAERTGGAVGGGTLTCAILAHAIFAEGLRTVVAALQAQTRPVEGRRERAQVATISAHDDPTLGETVAEAFERVRAESVVSVENERTTADLGTARRVIVERESTMIIGGAGKHDTIEARCRNLRRRIETPATSEYDKKKLEERLAKLSGGVAVVRVGAPSEAEMMNRKEACEDAISATRAAIAGGVVAGGGLALLRASNRLAEDEAACTGDERTGVSILARALEAPARQLAVDSGHYPGVVLERPRAAAAGVGFDASRGEHVDLFQAGIVDPAQVVRIALENAASVAGVLLLADGTLT